MKPKLVSNPIAVFLSALTPYDRSLDRAQGLVCACFAFEITQLDSPSEHI